MGGLGSAPVESWEPPKAVRSGEALPQCSPQVGVHPFLKWHASGSAWVLRYAEVSDWLHERGVRCLAYHGEHDLAQRRDAQRRFQTNDVQVR